MDTQLEWITSLFNKCGIKYWIDFGTLLTLKRDNILAKNDKDIDISIWWYDLHKIDQLIPDFKNKEYKYKWLIYKSIKYQFKLFPKKNSKLRAIDITVFFNYKDLYAWSPQRYTIESDNLFFKIIRSIIFYLFLIVPREVNVDKLPLKIISRIYTWWIPYEHFHKIIFSSDLQLYIPELYEEHLRLHYGNWRIPEKKWNFLVQDNALKHMIPEELFNP